jgi:histidine triad (HIT) family protein
MVVSHAPPIEGRTPYRGYLFVEPRRHVAGLADLDPAEATEAGRLVTAAAAALRAVAGADHVYAAVIGHAIPHLHIHVIPRYPGTPREWWWTRLDEWPDAPRVDEVEARRLAARLRPLIAFDTADGEGA